MNTSVLFIRCCCVHAVGWDDWATMTVMDDGFLDEEMLSLCDQLELPTLPETDTKHDPIFRDDVALVSAVPRTMTLSR